MLRVTGENGDENYFQNDFETGSDAIIDSNLYGLKWKL